MIVKMVMKNGLVKLSADSTPELVEIVDKASQIEGRTRAGFIRFHIQRISEEILLKEEQK